VAPEDPKKERKKKGLSFFILTKSLKIKKHLVKHSVFDHFKKKQKERKKKGLSFFFLFLGSSNGFWATLATTWGGPQGSLGPLGISRDPRDLKGP